MMIIQRWKQLTAFHRCCFLCLFGSATNRHLLHFCPVLDWSKSTQTVLVRMGANSAAPISVRTFLERSIFVLTTFGASVCPDQICSGMLHFCPVLNWSSFTLGAYFLLILIDFSIAASAPFLTISSNLFSLSVFTASIVVPPGVQIASIISFSFAALL